MLIIVADRPSSRSTCTWVELELELRVRARLGCQRCTLCGCIRRVGGTSASVGSASADISSSVPGGMIGSRPAWSATVAGGSADG